MVSEIKSSYLLCTVLWTDICENTLELRTLMGLSGNGPLFRLTDFESKNGKRKHRTNLNLMWWTLHSAGEMSPKCQRRVGILLSALSDQLRWRSISATVKGKCGEFALHHRTHSRLVSDEDERNLRIQTRLLIFSFRWKRRILTPYSYKIWKATRRMVQFIRFSYLSHTFVKVL